MTQEEVESIFSSIGNVQSCKIVKDRVTGKSLGYGFVKYYQHDHAEKAVNTLNGLRLHNKIIKVSYARPSSESIKMANLYVAGLPTNMSQKEMEALFSRYGTIIASRILYDNISVRQYVTNNNPPEGLSRGIGFVRFSQRVEAEKAIQELNGTVLEGYTEPITVKFSCNSNKDFLIHHALPQKFSCFPYASDVNSGSEWCIFVYNLPPESDDCTLWQLFGPFGAVQRVKVMKNLQTNECKGFGFVTMRNYADAVLAIHLLNGCRIGNLVLGVSFKI